MAVAAGLVAAQAHVDLQGGGHPPFQFQAVPDQGRGEGLHGGSPILLFMGPVYEVRFKGHKFFHVD
jgi:hypothetical protein